MGSFLAGLAGICITLLAIAFGAPQFIDWNSYRAVFEREASAVLGRPVVVGGDVMVRLLPEPRMSFGRVRIGDGAEALAEAEHVQLGVSILPLFDGVLEVGGVTLERPVLRLGLDPSGRLDVPPAKSAAGAFAPRGLALRDVRVNGGRIEWRGGADAPPARFDNLTGTLTVEPRGAVRVAAAADLAGRPGELRLVASPQAADWGIKASWASRDLQVRATLDGLLDGLGAAPRLAGQLALDVTTAQPASAAAVAPGLSLKGRAAATSQALALEDAVVTLTDARGVAQTLAGTARLEMATRRLDITGSATVLDIDRALGGAAPPAVQLAAATRQADALPLRPPAGRIALSIGEATLGGAALRDMRLAATLETAGWRIENLAARGPGDSTITLAGSASEDGAFSGRFDVAGRDADAFARWIMPGWRGALAAPGAFAAAGQVSADTARWTVDIDTATVLGGRLSGRVAQDGPAAAPELRVRLEGDGLDLRGVGDGALGATAAPPSLETWRAALPDRLELSLALRGMSLPASSLRDIEAIVVRRGAETTLTRLAVARPGLRLAGSGRWRGDAAETARLEVSAADATALAEAAQLLGIPPARLPARARLGDFAPLRLDATWAADQPGNAPDASFTAAGDAGPLRLTVTGTSRPPATPAGERTLDLRAGITAAEAGAAARLLPALAPRGAGPLTASATYRGGLGDAPGPATASLKLPAGSIDFTGEAAPFAARWRAAGRVTLATDDTAALLGLRDAAHGLLPARGEASGNLSIDGAKVTLAEAVMLGGADRFGGDLRFDAGATPPTVDATLYAGQVDAARLARLLQEAGATPPADAAAPGDAAAPPADLPFAALPDHAGTVTLRTPRLRLADGLIVDDATVTAKVQRGRLALDITRGTLFGGALKAELDLRRTATRLATRLDVKLGGAKLAGLPPGADGPLADGPAEFELNLTGEGYSPRAMASALAGKGRIRLGHGVVRRFSAENVRLAAQRLARAASVAAPFAPPAVAAAGGPAPQPAPAEDLPVTLDAALRSGSFSYRPVALPISVTGGVLTLAETTLSGASGKVTAQAMLDLATFGLDAELRIASGERGVPAVGLGFAGPLAEFGRMTPTIAAEDFSRTLTVRRMERDVEVLENLNAGRPPRGDSALVREPPPPADMPPPRVPLPEARVRDARRGPPPGANDAPGDARPPQRAPPLDASASWEVEGEQPAPGRAGGE